jgi:hypothetical protein
MKTNLTLDMWLYLYIDSWVQLLDGLVGILTFGLYNPYLSFKLCTWHSKRQCKKNIRFERNKSK